MSLASLTFQVFIVVLIFFTFHQVKKTLKIRMSIFLRRLNGYQEVSFRQHRLIRSSGFSRRQFTRFLNLIFVRLTKLSTNQIELGKSFQPTSFCFHRISFQSHYRENQTGRHRLID